MEKNRLTLDEVRRMAVEIGLIRPAHGCFRQRRACTLEGFIQRTHALAPCDTLCHPFQAVDPMNYIYLILLNKSLIIWQLTRAGG